MSTISTPVRSSQAGVPAGTTAAGSLARGVHSPAVVAAPPARPVRHYDERWSLIERSVRDCGHFSVICGIDRDRILLMDPMWRIQRRQWRRHRPAMDGDSPEGFCKRWYDTDTEMYVRVDHWYMVVHFDGRRFSSIVVGGIDHVPLTTYDDAKPTDPKRQCKKR